MTNRILAIIAFCLVAFALLPALAGSTLTGTVTHIRDADTIEVNGVAVRLNGVDAPELDTEIGRLARATMHDFLIRRQVRCTLNGERTYDRLVGTCYYHGGDVGAEMIRRSLALDCRRYSHGRYAHLETNIARQTIKRAGYCTRR